MFRYRYVHWTVCDIALGPHTVGSLVILAFVIPKLIDHQLQQGVYIYPTYVSRSTDFTFRFLPVLITILYSLLWLGADNFYRHY